VFIGKSEVDRERGRGSEAGEGRGLDSSCQGWNMRMVKPSLIRSRERWGTEKMILYSWFGA